MTSSNRLCAMTTAAHFLLSVHSHPLTSALQFPPPLSSILLHLETYSRLTEHPQFSIVMQAETVQEGMKDLTRKLVELNPYVTSTVTKTVSSPLPNVPLGIATHQQRGKW